jgi:hypothetical protein
MKEAIIEASKGKQAYGKVDIRPIGTLLNFMKRELEL